jgi:hypothetical protein
MKTFITARRHNGTMKTFITARRHKFPQNPKPDPLGSHVSSFLGRKAAQWQNENIYYRKAAQWQNENIYYRKAHNGKMKTFIAERRTMVQ